MLQVACRNNSFLYNWLHISQHAFQAALDHNLVLSLDRLLPPWTCYCWTACLYWVSSLPTSTWLVAIIWSKQDIELWAWHAWHAYARYGNWGCLAAANLHVTDFKAVSSLHKGMLVCKCACQSTCHSDWCESANGLRLYKLSQEADLCTQAAGIDPNLLATW